MSVSVSLSNSFQHKIITYTTGENNIGGVFGDAIWKSVRLTFIGIVNVVVAFKVNIVSHIMVEDMIESPSKAAASKRSESGTTAFLSRIPKVAPESPSAAKATDAKVTRKDLVTNGVVVGDQSRDTGVISRITSGMGVMYPARIQTCDLSSSKLNDYKKKIVRRLATLSNKMVVSAVSMIVASVFVFLSGTVYIYPYIQSRPYLYSFIYMAPWWLLQVSSIMEVRAVEEVITSL